MVQHDPIAMLGVDTYVAYDEAFEQEAEIVEVLQKSRW
jgi:hypothetical protein